MGKKRNEILSKMEEARVKLAEIERLAKEEEDESIKILEDATNRIKAIAEEKELFCGVVLTKDDILQIVSMAMSTNENITIPFKLYFKD